MERVEESGTLDAMVDIDQRLRRILSSGSGASRRGPRDEPVEGVKSDGENGEPDATEAKDALEVIDMTDRGDIGTSSAKGLGE